MRMEAALLILLAAAATLPGPASAMSVLDAIKGERHEQPSGEAPGGRFFYSRRSFARRETNLEGERMRFRSLQSHYGHKKWILFSPPLPLKILFLFLCS